MGVFARWVAGVWCLRAGRVRVGVWAFLVLVRLLGVVGQCGPAASLPWLACLRARALAWALLACARFVCARWAEGGQVGAGQRCPAPCCVALGCFGRSVARKERRWVGVLSWCANARARAERGRGGERGSLVGRTVVAWLGGVGGGACGW